MPNINLTTDSAKENVGSPMNVGNIIIFIVLLLFLAVYGGLIVWKGNIDKNIADIKNGTSADIAKFSSNDAKNMVDIQR